jgi:hypothetical protein
MAISLQQLEDDWFNYKPAGQRPLGGRRALMGFDYQISLSLNSFFDKVLKNDKRAVMAFEGLSDLSELRNGIVYLTQVKAALTQEGIKKSIHEFLAVDSFLEDMHESIRSKVRYRIASKATKGTVRQDLSGEELGLNPDEALRWAKIRSQLLAFEIQGDPSLELAIKLWNRVSKPFDFIATSRGLVLQSLAANESSEKISERLLERWQDEQTGNPPPGELLSPSVFEDLSEGQSHILVGQRPSIGHLNDGCFMEREELVSKVLEGLDSTSSYGPDMTFRKLPIIWISGGSGVGKSALLLEALRKLVIERETPINYLHHFPDQLPKSLRYWSRQGIPSLIAVDDLYAPDYRDVTLWSNVSRLAFEAPYATIITCGPDDYREAFEQYALIQGSISVIPVNVSALSISERERYREWYRVRTLQEEVKPIAETNFVVAAFLLEQRRKGDADIGEFSARFWQRLSQLGLAEEFLISLSVNRLGIEAPMSLFQSKRDAVGQLVSEGLVQLSESPEKEAQVLWFHPALARKIYDILTPQSKVETRAIHLSRYFSVIFDDHDRAVAFLQLLSNKKQKRVPIDLIKEILKNIGDVFKQKNPPELNIGYLFRYRDALSKTDLLFEKILPPGLLRRWITSPDVNREGWGLLLQLLWDYCSQEERDDLIEETISWLKANMDLEPWNYIWQKLWAYKIKDEFLIELARQWLAGHTDSKGWGFVFEKLYKAEVREDWLLQNGITGLLNSPVTIADKYLWSYVESLGPTPNAFLATLTQRVSNSTIPKVTRLGVKEIVNRILQIGIEPVIEGLNENNNALGWAFLFRDILNLVELSLSQNDKDRYITLGRAWLVGREDRPEWSFVWRRLLDDYPDDDELLKQGREWLGDREDRPEWSFVWRRLLDDYPDDEELLKQGRGWLVGREDRPEWSFVWRRLLDDYLDDDELLTQGRGWLRGREGRPEWSFVWQRLLDYCRDDEELLKQGRGWLVGREDSPAWSFVWRRLLDYYPGDDGLLKQGRGWLVGREDRPGYPFIKRRL